MAYGKKKYGNRTIYVDGIRFDSKHEAQRWKELQILEYAGSIYDLRRQVKFVLIPAQYIDGKLVERECSYKADFVYREKKTDLTVVEDAKGFQTDVYKIKKKLMLERFGIRIIEV